MTMTDILLTIISAALLNNLVLQWPLAVDPLLGAARVPRDARRQVHALGLATAVLMLISGSLGYALYAGLLLPMGLASLQLFVFIPLSVLLIAPVLALLSRSLPSWSFEGLWPLLLGNAGILGLALLNAQQHQGLGYAVAFSLGAGLGFWLVLSLFSDLRERIRDNDIPTPFRGLPIELIGAGLMAVAFLGFNGLIKT